MITRTLLAASALASMASSAYAAGAFETLPAADGEACAQACSDDTLCMAWRFDAGACALRATVPADPIEGVFGLSQRALDAGFSPAAKSTLTAAPVSGGAKDEPLAVTESASPADALLGGPEPIEMALNAGAQK
jgi:hypothetical protein